MKRKELFRIAPSSFEVEPYLPPTQVEEIVTLDDGTLVKRTSLKKIDPRKEFKKFRASDFALQNLVLSGVEDTLHSSIIKGSTLFAADNVDLDEFGNLLSEHVSQPDPITPTPDSLNAVTE